MAGVDMELKKAFADLQTKMVTTKSLLKNHDSQIYLINKEVDSARLTGEWRGKPKAIKSVKPSVCQSALRDIFAMIFPPSHPPNRRGSLSHAHGNEGVRIRGSHVRQTRHDGHPEKPRFSSG